MSERKCSVDGCDRLHWARGFCGLHYQRWKTHGTPERMHRIGKTWSFVEACVTEKTTACILWKFALNRDGYGVTWRNRKSVQAHFAVCTLAHGQRKSADLEARHLCGNRACVNPAHLAWGTCAENQEDRRRHGTLPLGETVYCAKLTDSQVRVIRSSSETGLQLARRFGVTPSTISSIRCGHTWKHVE